MAQRISIIEKDLLEPICFIDSLNHGDVNDLAALKAPNE